MGVGGHNNFQPTFSEVASSLVDPTHPYYSSLWFFIPQINKNKKKKGENYII